MGIEETFGYRFVRTSLVLLNGLILLRLISLLLQFNHDFDSTFIFFIVVICANFGFAVIGAVREHRITVILTGSVTLIMFLSLIFTTKETKGVNVFLLILLAVSVQSLIFSEMLKERQIFMERRQRFLQNLNRNGGNFRSEDVRRLTAVVVAYPSPNGSSSRLTSGAVFTLDPELSNELAKDPPPPYFSAMNCPPPKYEDALQLDASSLAGTSGEAPPPASSVASLPPEVVVETMTPPAAESEVPASPSGSSSSNETETSSPSQSTSSSSSSPSSSPSSSASPSSSPASPSSPPSSSSTSS